MRSAVAKRWLAWGLAIAVGFAIPSSPMARRVRQQAAKSSAGKLKDKKRSIDARRRKLEAEKRAKKQRLSQVKGRIEHLDNQLSQTQRSLENLDIKLVKLRSHHGFLEKERDKKVDEYKANRETFKRRLVTYYKAGPSAMSSLLFGASNYTDMAVRTDYMRAIAAHDRAVLQRVRNLYEEIQDNIQVMDEEIQKIHNLEEEERRAQVRLTREQNEKRNVMTQLSRDIETLDRMMGELEAISNSIAAEIARQSAVYSRGLSRDGFMHPVPMFCSMRSGFGSRVHPISGRRRMHTGVDLACATGTPVRAASTGRVFWAARKGGYGNAVILVHAGGLSTLYGHLSRIYVRPQQVVRRGEVIGAVGSTGYSTGPHLHYEVHSNGHVINPLAYLR